MRYAPWRGCLFVLRTCSARYAGSWFERGSPTPCRGLLSRCLEGSLEVDLEMICKRNLEAADQEVSAASTAGGPEEFEGRARLAEVHALVALAAAVGSIADGIGGPAGVGHIPVLEIVRALRGVRRDG